MFVFYQLLFSVLAFGYIFFGLVLLRLIWK